MNDALGQGQAESLENGPATHHLNKCLRSSLLYRAQVVTIAVLDLPRKRVQSHKRVASSNEVDGALSGLHSCERYLGGSLRN